MLKEYARLIELCQDLVFWLESEDVATFGGDVRGYIRQIYPDLYHKIFGYEDD